MSRTIAVFCPNLIGDTVMATPTFRALRVGNPDARIIAVVKPSVSPVLDGNPWFDERLLLDHRSKNSQHHPKHVIAALRKQPLDVAVLLPNSFRSALLALRAGAKQRVGYARGGRSLLLTDRLTPLRDRFGRYTPTPIVDYYLAIAKLLKFPVDSSRTELFTTATDESAADLALANLGIDRNQPFVCLNTGGAFGPAKAWPEAHFAKLAERLVNESDMSVLVLCGPSERDPARSIVALSNSNRVVSLADQSLSLGLSKACVKRCSLLVTTDSGPRHFAPAFNVPVLTLFGPTHIAWTRTHHPLSLHILNPVDCGPCQKPVCPKGHHRCMKDLAPDAVFEAAKRLLPRPISAITRPHLVIPRHVASEVE